MLFPGSKGKKQSAADDFAGFAVLAGRNQVERDMLFLYHIHKQLDMRAIQEEKVRASTRLLGSVRLHPICRRSPVLAHDLDDAHFAQAVDHLPHQVARLASVS